jgi:hypothetical protein
MSIVGTDGYTDGFEVEVAAETPQRSFQLTVPGAEQGIRDVITLRITPPTGAVLTRETSLVFG